MYDTKYVKQMSEKILEGGDISDYKNQKALTSIDKYIGEKIKNRRIILGLTQKDLGAAVGVTPQQIQKYESAVNRVASSTLYYFAQFLRIPVDYFFGSTSSSSSSSLNEGAAEFSASDNDEISERELLKIINAYRSIKNSDVRKRIGGLIEEIGASSSSTEK